MVERTRALFTNTDAATTAASTRATENAAAAGKKRVAEPERSQGEIRFGVPDDLLPPSHPARLLWNVLGTLDLSAFKVGFSAVEGGKGRSRISPRMLLTLWLYGISIGIGSAREIGRRVKADTAFQWIVGDLDVSHHTLSAFRVGYGDALETLMTNVLASLIHKDLISLDLMAQDGTRTRAAAAAPSFRTKGGLLQCREQAALHLKAVLNSAGDPEHTRGEQARREAAARDYQKRVEAAIATVQELQNGRTGSSDKAPRASTTDAEARVMKMGDGGFRPAFNVQYGSVGSPMGGPRAIVAFQVNNVGSDMGSLTPMAEQVRERTGTLPKVVLADGGHAKNEDIIALKSQGVDVIVPPSDKAKALETLRAENAHPELIAWRERMETPEAAELYRARAGICELPNAHQKSHHGLTQFLVRGLEKVTCVVLLHAIASNLGGFAAKLLA
jgi:transposase